MTDNIGTLGGLCNRKACRAPKATMYNLHTNAHYCRPCSFMLDDVFKREDMAPMEDRSAELVTLELS